ncbi:MAG: TolC family protein [Pseudomonadota bacterium]|nr:TolC family protein [Pseudomonadota bacterium]
MKQFLYWCLCVPFMLSMSVPPLAADATDGNILTLEQAISLALDSETVSQSFEYRAEGFEEEAVAAGGLPDPKLKLGAMNFPTDTFDRDQEPMTQLQVGVVQLFPRGSSRTIKSQINNDKAEKSRHMASDARLMAARDVSKYWLELYYWLQAEIIVEQSRGWFSNLVGVTESRYRVGSATQQDVVQSELELNRLTDRLEGIRIKQDMSRSDLSRWIGALASMRNLPKVLPIISPPATLISTPVLGSHPVIQAKDAEIQLNTDSVELSRQAYKPGFALDVTYGDRSGQNPDNSDRANFLSAMVLMDIPLFTNKRQDKKLASSLQKLEAVKQDRETAVRTLSSKLQRARSSLRILERQILLYRDKLVPQSSSHSELALKAYENSRVEFDSVMRARVAELDTQLKAIRLEVDRAQTIAMLNYLAGEAK